MPQIDGLFTCEAVAPGHPDKICDQISDAILDACLAPDPDARVAIEAALKGDLLCLMGEITSHAPVDAAVIAQQVLCDIGHADGRWGVDPERLRIVEAITRQSAEIATGVDGVDIGAGDQGLMFGFATDETESLMPLPLTLARELIDRLGALRAHEYAHQLGPDAKAQVTVRYEGGRPAAVTAVVISCQHARNVSLEELRRILREHVLDPVLGDWHTEATELHINPAGSFHEGGPVVDAGLTGRKIIADTYGGFARHGGGAFSGKDATKVDRSAAYAARQIARDVVARGWARHCEVRVAYAIGTAAPVAIGFDTFGTGVGSDPAERYARIGVDIADLMRPTAIVERLQLRRPIYRDTAAHGHFGRPGLPWEAPLMPPGQGAEISDPPTEEERSQLTTLRWLIRETRDQEQGFAAGMALNSLIARYPLTARKLLAKDAAPQKETDR